MLYWKGFLIAVLSALFMVYHMDDHSSYQQHPPQCDLSSILSDYNKQLQQFISISSKMVIENTPYWIGQDPSIINKLKQRQFQHIYKVVYHWGYNEKVLYRVFQDCKGQPSPPPQLGHNKNVSRFIGYTNPVQIITHIHRDWTEDGQPIRGLLYKPILDELSQISSKKTILVPGSGLGRLAYEIAHIGHKVVAIEYSPLMSIASKHIIQHLGNDQSIFYPNIYETLRNTYDSKVFFTPSYFPDKKPMTDHHPITTLKDITILTGDFISHAKKLEKKYDVITTCFFIDTATNTLDYIWAIKKLLSRDGLWINVGPLHYHVDISRGGVHYTLEDLFSVFDNFGFQLIMNKTLASTPYAPEMTGRSLYSFYNPIFFIARLK